MANPTSNFNWQMPTPTDLVTDLPADFEVFGQAVDTSLADLKGGTTGQVLAKNSGTDMDFVWVAQDDSNAIQNAIVDAKGDLIAATANDTPARLAVGTNNFFLQAASGETTGLKWGGTFSTYTPVLFQNGVVATSSASGRFIQIGKMVYGHALIVASGTGSAGNRVKVSYPIAPQTQNVFIPVGGSVFYDASSFNVYPAQVVVEDATYFNFTITDAIAGNGAQYVGVTGFTAAIASGDQIGFSFCYEVA
jgi:hypothetical protein